MYVKKSEREKVEKLNAYLKDAKFPDKWRKFIREEKNKEYLAIKNIKARISICTHCNEKFECSQKIDEYVKCPNCKFILKVKSNRLRNYRNRRDLVLIQKHEDGYVMRIFELYISYHPDCNKKIEFHLTEWGRKVIDKYFQEKDLYTSNNLKNNMGYLYIIHYEKTKEWKLQNFGYPLSFSGKYYPYNLKELFYDINPYSEIWTLAKNVDHLYFLPLARESLVLRSNTLELLTKAKLYNLANNSYHYKSGKFEDSFGVDKSYLPFMVENNITPNELEVLAKYKIKDINFIRYITNFNYYFLDEILNFCKPMDLYKYKLNPNRASEYLDYIRFAIQLGFDIKDKKYLYPKNLKRKHDEYMSQIEINKNKRLKNKINIRYKKLEKNTFENGKFIIFPVASVESLEEESKQQNNCVRTYAESIADGKCDIYFMRLASNKDKSLVTVEVKNEHIVQKRTKNNQQTTKEQDKFLDIWERKILRGGL